MEPSNPFQVVVKGTNGTTVVNSTLSAEANDMTLTVYRMEHYIIQIAAENEVGTGPFSQPLNVEFDPIILIAETDIESAKNERTLQILIIGVVSAAIFVIILISAVICYKKKLNQNKPSGYLAASTAEDFHCQLNRGPIIKNQDYVDGKRASKDTSSLWIDRRWNDSCEKDSNSSEKKLLHAQHHAHSNSNSETEYAYVENKHNISSFTNSSGGSRKGAAESPEPYATTDIFQKHNLSQPNHYAAPIIRPSNYASNYVRRNVHSCDDLTDAEPRSQTNYLVPHNYQRASNTGGNKMRKTSKPKNLLDMIPPPPLHPPPPTTSNNIYNKSQESVISPKYLFAHPMYQQGPNNHYRVQPVVSRSHYEQVDHCHQQPRLAFDRDCHDELQHFNSILTQFKSGSGKSRDQFSLHCEADNEADEGSSLASHKSNDNYA